MLLFLLLLFHNKPSRYLLYEEVNAPESFDSLLFEPHAGSGFVRIDSLHFLAGCRKRRLNQALSVFLSVGFFVYLLLR